MPAIFGHYQHPHTKRWAEVVDAYDGFVFITPEYNHSMPAALKNAMDYLFAEWNDKAAGFVSYGTHGGTRAVEHLRLVLAELKVATVRSHAALSVFTDFEPRDPTDPTPSHAAAPGENQHAALTEMLDEILTLARALRSVRAAPAGAGNRP